MRVGLAFVGLAVALSACATVTKGRTDTFHVSTEPPGASVRTTLGGNDPTYGCDATPCGFDVPRRSMFVATVEKPGFHSVKIVVRNSEFKRVALNDLDADSAANGSGVPTAATVIGTSTAAQIGLIKSESLAAMVGTSSNAAGAAFAGLFFAPQISIVTDAVSGSLNDLYPNPVGIRLIPDSEPIPEGLAVRALDGDAAFVSVREGSSSGD